MKFIYYEDNKPINLNRINSISKNKYERFYYIDFYYSDDRWQWGFISKSERDKVYNEILNLYCEKIIIIGE